MPITIDTLKFYTAERMTDNEDGGGQMTANEIISGAANQIFDDVSDVDRAAGDLSIRKVYSAVISPDTDKYLDAGVVIFKPPTDPNTSVLQFSTGSYYDERDQLVAMLESTVSRGRRYFGAVYGQHVAGQRALLLWMAPGAEPPPPVGWRMNLVGLSGGTETHSEYVWITKVTSQDRTITDISGQFVTTELTLDLAYPLEYAYTGTDPSRFTPSATGASALVYEARYNPDLVALAGIKPLASPGAPGEFTVTVDGGLYQQMIPTGLQETAIADTTPAGEQTLLVAATADETTLVTLTTTVNAVKPDGSLFLGTPAMPGTITIAVSGATLTDDNGLLYSGATEIGTVDYGNGVCTFNSACPNYGTASKTITYRPGVKTIRVGQTASIRVTAENRGYVYVLTLAPLPTPGSLRVSYTVSGNWYTLIDQGGGVLAGISSAYGAGTLNGITGTVTITTGELPDIDSDILFIWGTQTDFRQRGNLELNPIKVKGNLVNNLPVYAGSLTLAWNDAAQSVTDDGRGQLTGDATGTIDYRSGGWELTFATLPDPGAQVAASYQYVVNGARSDYGDPARNGNEVTWVFAGTEEFAPGSIHLHLLLKSSGIRVAEPDPPPDGYEIDYEDARRQVILHDDGDGNLVDGDTVVGSVDYVNRMITIPDQTVFGTIEVTVTYESVGKVGTWTDPETGETVDKNGLIKTYVPIEHTTILDPDACYLDYQWATDVPAAASETYTINTLTLDVTRSFSEVVSGVEFTIGSSRYVELNRQVFLNPDFTTGVGALAGTLDANTGEVRLTTWTGGVANTPVVTTLVTTLNQQLADSVIFRTPLTSLRPGSVQVRAITETGDVLSDTVPSSGVLATGDWTVGVDHAAGVIRIRFGVWRPVAELTPAELLEPWYDPSAMVSIGGVDKIWRPLQVRMESIIYNAVAQSILPPDREMIGIDASRLPPDGKGLIYQRGKLALIHHTDTLAQANLSPTQTLDCGRVRLYRAVIDDAQGARLPASCYSVNRELGTVTMAADLNLTGYAGPYTLSHTVADLVRITETDISGRLTLNKALSHAFPAAASYISGVLYIGTLQARYTNLFAQTTWTNVWSDARIGDAPLAQYNDTAWPIQVSNLGAYKDRILIQFTSSTAFRVIGENLGVIANGDITQDCLPINQLTGQPYFTIKSEGWGAGWATGNCVRFNLIGANYPIALIRAVQPSLPSGLDDSVELLFVGNVDAE